MNTIVIERRAASRASTPPPGWSRAWRACRHRRRPRMRGGGMFSKRNVVPASEFARSAPVAPAGVPLPPPGPRP